MERWKVLVPVLLVLLVAAPLTAHASRRPDGSRADVRARGVWKNGRWTVEFARRLDTGNTDDIRLDPGNAAGYLFGVSIAGLYGEPVDEGKPHPYGQGRISEPLILKFR